MVACLQNAQISPYFLPEHQQQFFFVFWLILFSSVLLCYGLALFLEGLRWLCNLTNLASFLLVRSRSNSMVFRFAYFVRLALWQRLRRLIRWRRHIGRLQQPKLLGSFVVLGCCIGLAWFCIVSLFPGKLPLDCYAFLRWVESEILGLGNHVRLVLLYILDASQIHHQNPAEVVLGVPKKQLVLRIVLRIHLLDAVDGHEQQEAVLDCLHCELSNQQVAGRMQLGHHDF